MHGSDITASLAKLPATRNAAALIRHAQRHPLGSSSDPTQALLTDAGKQAARELGARLSGFSHLRLFHSPVRRCQQTAECIAEGAQSTGMRVEVCGPRERLSFVCTLDMPAAVSLWNTIGEEFVTRWLTGALPEHMMEAPIDTARLTLREVDVALKDQTPHGRRLDLHISHDWNIMVTRELLTGVRHEEAGWLGFLDGLSFSRCENSTLTVRAGNTERTCALPWTEFTLRKQVA